MESEQQSRAYYELFISTIVPIYYHSLSFVVTNNNGLGIALVFSAAMKLFYIVCNSDAVCFESLWLFSHAINMSFKLGFF